MIKRNEIIRETGLSDKDIKELREKFVEKYISEKGWNKNTLSMEQLNEIQQQDEYRKPGMLLS